MFIISIVATRDKTDQITLLPEFWIIESGGTIMGGA
jgi:hypothetical protein